MNSKSNQILVGLILLLLGAVAFIMNIIKIDYGAITLAFVGLAFLLLYYTKKKSWSLVVGSYLAYFGVIKIISQLGFHYPLPNAIGVMFFLLPGVIFWILYYHKNKRGLLIPASLLIWVGIYILLVSSTFFNQYWLSLFLICFGLSFVMMYVLGKDFIKRMTLYFGIFMLVVGAFAAVGLSLDSFATVHVSQLISIIVVITGVVIILKAVVKK